MFLSSSLKCSVSRKVFNDLRFKINRNDPSDFCFKNIFDKNWSLCGAQVTTAPILSRCFIHSETLIFSVSDHRVSVGGKSWNTFLLKGIRKPFIQDIIRLSEVNFSHSLTNSDNLPAYLLTDSPRFASFSPHCIAVFDCRLTGCSFSVAGVSVRLDDSCLGSVETDASSLKTPCQSWCQHISVFVPLS